MPVTKTLHILVATTLLAIWTSNGCGYRSLSTPTPFDATSVTLIPFHESQPIGLSQTLNEHLSLQLVQSGVNLTNSLGSHGALLTGTIESATTVASPTSAVDRTTPSFQVALRAIAKLEDSKGEALWQKKYLLNDSFLQDLQEEAQSVLVTESGRRVALGRVAEKLAKQIASDLMLAHTLNSSTQSQKATTLEPAHAPTN